MTEKKKIKVVLRCPEGPCASPIAPEVKTDVIIEVREKRAGASAPVVAAVTKVTLTSLDHAHKLEPKSTSQGSAGQLIATFKGVPQGWYRALAVRSGASGEPEASAARNVQVVKIKGAGSEEPQHVILTMTKQGVATFVFVNDLDEAPLSNTNVVIRHPDGGEQRHTTSSNGELLLPGGVGEVFSLVRIEHATNTGISATETQESS